MSHDQDCNNLNTAIMAAINDYRHRVSHEVDVRNVLAALASAYMGVVMTSNRLESMHARGQALDSLTDFIADQREQIERLAGLHHAKPQGTA
jgi:hypothetical protein